MLKLSLPQLKESDLHLLFLGAHSDDIEIGCGGTVLKLVQESTRLCVDWIVFSSTPDRSTEARESAEEFIAGVKQKNIIVKNFRDGFFPYRGEEIKEYFEELKQSMAPDLIFTHYRQDLHQDHRLINELTWNTFRNHMILEYEIPKFDGDLGSPNLFVHLEKNHCRRKVEIIEQHFKTQKDKPWFSEETFTSMLRLRGMEARAPEGFAEGFYCRKVAILSSAGRKN